MKKINLLPICICSLLGLFLLVSYDLTDESGLWFNMDSAIFHFFNAKLVAGSVFTTFVGVINVRGFDVVSFCLMAALFYAYFRRQPQEGKTRMIAMGLAMLLIAVFVKQCDWLMPIEHTSPTLFFEGANRVSELVSFSTKDASGNSFPGDHGMVLFIFTAFMARYFGRKAFAAASIIALLCSFPRVMAGAHWFGDIYAGSLGVCLITLSWILLTPFSDWLIEKLRLRLVLPGEFRLKQLLRRVCQTRQTRG